MAWRLALLIPLWIAHGIVHRLQDAIAGDEVILSGQPLL